MVFPDLSLTLSQRRRACVLDPALILSRLGLLLVRRLGEALELWVPREFWHILDNSQFYVEHPSSLLPAPEGNGAAAARSPGRDEIAKAIREWERVRLESDLGGLNFYWVGDGLSESLVPAGTGADLVWRYEALARALERRADDDRPLASAACGTSALAAALGNAFVLTRGASENSSSGAICRLAAASVECHRVVDTDPLVLAEREHLRRVLVHTAAASLLWSGLDLAVLHLAVPAAVGLHPDPVIQLSDDLAEEAAAEPAGDGGNDPWEGARAFWYPLYRAGSALEPEGRLAS